MSRAIYAPPTSPRINFARGVPANAAIPRSEIELCVKALSCRDDFSPFQYGPAAGPMRLREWIARQHEIDASQVIVANGSVGLFDLFCRVALKPGKLVLVESPCYDRALQLLRIHEADLWPVRIEADGPVIEDIERILATARPSFYYMVPDFQNPSGVVYSLEKRRAVISLARIHGFRLVEDSRYRLLRYRGEPLPSFHELAPDVTLQLGSFSKLLSPALRAAYLLADARTIALVGTMAENIYVTLGNLALSVTAEWLSRGLLEAQVERLRRLYAPRLAAMIAALEEYSPSNRFLRPEGGFFLGLTLNASVDAATLATQAARAGIDLADGARFFVEPPRQPFLRLPFCAMDEETIRHGVRRLAEILARS
jgi:2-aminoadipate transaminase